MTSAVLFREVERLRGLWIETIDPVLRDRYDEAFDRYLRARVDEARRALRAGGGLA